MTNADQRLGDGWYYGMLRQGERFDKAAKVVKECYPDWKSPEEVSKERKEKKNDR